MANTVQDFRAEFPIADPETGLISPEFLRFLQERGFGLSGAEGDIETLQTDLDALEDNEIVAGVGLSGGGLLSLDTITLDLEDTAVTPGSYTNVSLTVDQQGRITAASSGTAGTGTVTSVAQTVPVGFTVSGSPITTSGTLAISFDTGYSLPTDADQTNWDAAFSWGDHALAGYLDAADIGVTVQAYDAQLADIAGISFSTGDIVYYNGTNLVRLAAGTNDQVLTLASGVPSWADATGGGGTTLSIDGGDANNSGTPSLAIDGGTA